MALFTFNGRNASGFTSVGGLVFPTGEAVPVSDEAIIAKLEQHPEFTAADPLDHDGDGEKGGSLQGENATARRRGRPRKKKEIE